MGEEEAEEDGEEEDKGRLVVFLTKLVSLYTSQHTSLPVPYVKVTFLFRRVSLHVLRFSLTSTPSSPPTYCTLSRAHTPRTHTHMHTRVCMCVCMHACACVRACVCRMCVCTRV